MSPDHYLQHHWKIGLWSFSLFIMFSFFVVLPSRAQVAAWSPVGFTNHGPSPFSATTLDPEIATGEITRGTGVGTGGAANANFWGGNNWSNTDAAAGIAADKLVTFSITGAAGSTVSVSSMDILYRRSSTGPSLGILEYSVGGAPFAVASPIAFSAGTSSVGSNIPTINLSGVSDLQNVAGGVTITFRIIPYGATTPVGSWWLYGSGLRINGSADISLPLFLLQASARWLQYPVLTWTVLNTPLHGFVIERSIDGHSFVKVGEVKNSSTDHLLNYQFTDHSAEQHSTYYYRLSQPGEENFIDYSQIFMVSRIQESIAVDNSSPGEITLYLSGLGVESRLKVYDLSGRIFSSRALSSEVQSIQLSLPIGLYFLEIVSSDFSWVEKTLVR